MLAVVDERLGFAGLDDERTIHAALFLECRMAVIPVRPPLTHREPVRVRVSRSNAVEAQPRHAVHVGGHQDAVPVNRRILAERIGHAQGDGVPFPPAQRGGRDGAVHGHGQSSRAGEVHQRLADVEVEFRAGQCHRLLPRTGLGPGGGPPQAESSDRAADRQPLDERAP